MQTKYPFCVHLDAQKHRCNEKHSNDPDGIHHQTFNRIIHNSTRCFLISYPFRERLSLIFGAKLLHQTPKTRERLKKNIKNMHFSSYLANDYYIFLFFN